MGVFQACQCIFWGGRVKSAPEDQCGTENDSWGESADSDKKCYRLYDNCNIQWVTEEGVLSPDGETAAAPPHVHDMTGTQNFLMHNALEVGDEVIILRQQEGQKFIVADRIGGRR